MPRLQLQDVSLYYEFGGSGNRPVLMLSNSLGTHLDLWSQQLEAFSEHFSVLRYDARGQGRSSTPAGPCSIEQMGADALALLNELEVDQASFCGISMGGMVGQWLGLHAPHRLHQLVLSNTAAKIGSDETWNQRIATVEANGIEPIVATVLNGWFTQPFHREHPEVIAKMEGVLLANNPAGYVAGCAAVRDADFRTAVHSIDTPTLVIYGTEDRSTTPHDAMFLLDQIKDAQGLRLHAAHISNVEAADEFTSGVLTFLRPLYV